MEKSRIGVLISGSGSNLQAIIDACEAKRINGEVVFVGSDRPDVFGLERAEKHKIPKFVVNYAERLKKLEGINAYILRRDHAPKDYDWDDVLRKQGVTLGAILDEGKSVKRAIIEAELLAEMNKFGYDLLVLAGFMRILSPYFIDKVNINQWNYRIMNIHPAILPAFPGTDGYGDTWRYGCKVAGCTVHFVDYGEDTGPIIGQQTFAVQEGETIEDIKTRGLELEWKLYSECIQLFAEDRLRVIERDIGNGRVKKIVWIAPPDKAEA